MFAGAGADRPTARLAGGGVSLVQKLVLLQQWRERSLGGLQLAGLLVRPMLHNLGISRRPVDIDPIVGVPEEEDRIVLLHRQLAPSVPLRSPVTCLHMASGFIVPHTLH